MELFGRLNKFLDKKDSHCFLLRGDWGVGKTYLIDKWIEDIKTNKAKSKKYVFIKLSLFGIGTVNDLNALALNSSCFFNKFVKFLEENDINVSAGGPSFSVNIPLPLTGILGNLLKTKVNYPKRKTANDENIKYVFVIDDIERKDQKLAIEEIFGFIDQMPTDRTKVVLIANTEKLTYKNKKDLSAPDGGVTDEKYNFDKFKEKVIQEEYLVEKPDAETIKAVAGEKLFKIINCYQEFIVNLRTIQKLKQVLEQVGDVDDIVVRCIFLSLLNINDKYFNKEKLTDFLGRDEELIFQLNGQELNEDTLGKKIQKELKQYKEPEQIFSKCVSEMNLLPEVNHKELKKFTEKIYICVSKNRYKEISQIEVKKENPFEPVFINIENAFFSQNPTQEYLNTLKEMHACLETNKYDNIDIFKLFVNLSVYTRKYISPKKEIIQNEDKIIKAFARLLPCSLCNSNDIDKYNRCLFFANKLPKVILKARKEIALNTIKNKCTYLRERNKLSLLKVTEIGEILSLIEMINGTQTFNKIINVDNLVLSIIKRLYKNLGGDIRDVWQDAHSSFKWIKENETKLPKSIKYITENAKKRCLASKRLNTLCLSHGLI